MRLLSFICVLLLFCNQLVASTPVSDEIANQDLPSQLKLTTFIKSQKYCKSKIGAIDSLRIELGLRYTNLGKNNLILYKYGKSINQVMVSQSLENASAKRFIIDMSLTVVTSGGAKIEDNPIPEEHYVVLPPNGSYEPTTSQEISILLNQSGNQRPEGTLNPGSYYLQVNLSTWPETKSMSNRLQEHWQKIGTLWYENLKSEAMQFSVEQTPSFEDCSPFAELLAAGRTNPNAKLTGGFTALMAAIYRGEEEQFFELLKKGADVNAQSDQGWTALTLAATHSETDFLKELIQRGANLNSKTENGDTALLISIGKCDVDSIKILLTAGADINAKNKKGQTALMFAKEECRDEPEIIELLKQAEIRK